MQITEVVHPAGKKTVSETGVAEEAVAPALASVVFFVCSLLAKGISGFKLEYIEVVRDFVLFLPFYQLKLFRVMMLLLLLLAFFEVLDSGVKMWKSFSATTMNTYHRLRQVLFIVRWISMVDTPTFVGLFVKCVRSTLDVAEKCLISSTVLLAISYSVIRLVNKFDKMKTFP